MLSTVLLLYFVALHCSIAGMEILGWLGVVLGVWVRVQTPEGRRGLTLPMGVVWPFLLFLSAVLVGLVLNPELKGFWFQLGFMRFGILLIGLIWALDLVWDETFAARLYHVWLGCVLVVGSYAIFQCVTGIDFIRPGSGALTLQGGDFYKTPAFFSISLTFAYSFGTSLLFGARLVWTRRRWWEILIWSLGLVGFFTSMSRGAWLAMLATVAIYLVFEHRRWLLPFAGAVGAVTAGLIFFTHGFGDRLYRMVTMQLDSSSSTRLSLWRGYWEMFLDHPLWGVGIFQGDKLLPIYYERLGVDPATLASHAHNNFLQILAGCGIVGFLGFVWLIGVFFVRSMRLRLVSPWGWSTFLALLFVFLGGLTECNFIDGEVNHMIVWVWAVVWVLSLREDAREL